MSDFKTILLNTLFLKEEISGPKNNKGILFLDIDDTLLKAKNIFIYRSADHPSGPAKLTPEQYAKEMVTAETKQYYDYSDFRNPEKVSKSITTGMPIIPNLKMMDIHIKNGWRIGILTARGMEDIINSAISEFLMYKTPSGDLKKIGDKLVRDYVHAINDTNKQYEGKTDFEKKAKVLKKYANKGYQIKFLDDDEKNIQAVRKLAQEENLDIQAIKAHKG